MIELRKLSPTVLASATAATVGLAVAVVALTSYCCHRYAKPVEQHAAVAPADEDGRYVVGELRDLLHTVGDNGSPNCRDQAYMLADFVDRGELTPDNAESLIACYQLAHDNAGAAIISQVMTQRFPQNPVFYNYLGSYQLEFNDLDSALVTLNKGLELENSVGLSSSDSAMLHNNFAWALLQTDYPNLDTIEYHTRRAVELDHNHFCSILHTRLTYEFAKALQTPRESRDLSEWIRIRAVYFDCIDQMRGPDLKDDNGDFIDDSFSYQFFSRFVMERMLLTPMKGMDPYMAHLLSATEGAIERLGPEQFCKNAMALRRADVQAVCVDAAKSLDKYFN